MEDIQKYKHVLAVVLCDYHIGSPQEDLIVDDLGFFSSKFVNEAVVENSFVIINKSANAPISETLFGKIFNASIATTPNY